MLRLPASRKVVTRTTRPSCSRALPMARPLSEKVTVPRARDPVEVTVAVSVTGCPTQAGFGDTDSAVRLVGAPTVSPSAADVDAA